MRFQYCRPVITNLVALVLMLGMPRGALFGAEKEDTDVWFTDTDNGSDLLGKDAPEPLDFSTLEANKSVAELLKKHGTRMTRSETILRNTQRYLQVLGYDPGPVDGTLGPQTRAAIREFQRDAGLAATGMLSKNSLAELNARIVRNIQYALEALGHDPGPVDGAIGSQTRTAIRKFQKGAGLPVTGEVSAALLDSLEGADTAKFEGANQSVTVVSPGNVRKVTGRMQFRRNAKGGIVDCSVKHVKLDNSWCIAFTSLDEQNTCTVGLTGPTVLHVKCK